MIISSEAYHARRNYDPVKAREYYLRTRKLKGRGRGRREDPPSNSDPPAAKRSGTLRPSKNKAAKRAAAKAEVEKLEARLDRLKDVLSDLVEAAKARSGVESESKDKDKKSEQDDDTESPKEKRKLTTKEKREAAKRQKEAREKEQVKKPGPNKEAEQLREQIKDIRAEIQEALEDARKKSKDRAKRQTASRGR